MGFDAYGVLLEIGFRILVRGFVIRGADVDSGRGVVLEEPVEGVFDV
jgi:hypothetical protein